ncbi:HlyD family efflux transporter periplasmic adaptor subunit [Novosphingobium sp. Fuku2-ISO-50]|uniref:HlyD family efflux transporter periplasmic adaptor subunit n=1 Tax=Novosphingobium sp. Fuku2-ISO-50 TaxID=1739114 RepID=UPI001E32EE93|nr:HlyD family efflux transporter periplasmic adaptor subunit [Novosphingobium sp. Fuku2-ISO-50]
MSVSRKSSHTWLDHRAVMIYLIGAVLVLAVVWSIYSELDQVSRAPGQVIPSGHVQVLQSTDGGTIAQILVKEGDVVTRGQLLVTLDKVRIQAAVDEAEGKVASLRATMVRINAELFDKALVFPPEVRKFPDLMADQSLLYEKRRRALNDQLTSLRAMLALNQQELDMNLPLLKQGDVSRADVLRLERSVSDLQSQLVNVRNKYISDLQAEYTKTDEDLVAAQEILDQRKDALQDTEIHAPVNGIVKNIHLTTVGGVLKASDEVLSIVPTGEELVVEARVSPSDIANIKPGEKASVKFDAYDSSIYGSANGRVVYVSPDTISEVQPSGTTSYYRVRISVDTSQMKPHYAGEKIVIQPGMTVTAEIQTGRNTVFRYLTKPISKTFGESLHEK